MAKKERGQLGELRKHLDCRLDQMERQRGELECRLRQIEELLKLCMANQLTNELAAALGPPANVPTAPKEDSDSLPEIEQTTNRLDSAEQSPSCVVLRASDTAPYGEHLNIRLNLDGKRVGKGCVIARHINGNDAIRATMNGTLIFAPRFREFARNNLSAPIVQFSVEPGEPIATILY